MKEEIVKKKVSKKINEKIVYVLLNIAKVIALAMVGFLFIAAFTHTAYFYTDKIDFYHEGLFYKVDNVIVNILLMMVIGIIIYFLNSLLCKIKHKRIVVILFFIIMIFLGACWNSFIKAPIKSDQLQVLNDAKMFAENNYKPLDDYSYLYQHPLQLGITVFESLIIRIFKVNYENVFKVINVISITIALFFLYKIANIKVDSHKEEYSSYTFLILMLSLLVIPFYTVVVYGNVVGFMFIIISIYFLVKYLNNNNLKNIFLSVIFAFISYLLKSNYVIMIIAMILALIIDTINKFKWKNLVYISLMILVCLGSYPLLNLCMEVASGKKINDGIPMVTYIAMSINQKPISRNSGWYGEETTVETIYHASSFNYQDTANVSKMIISDRLKYFINNPLIAIKFYQDKICSTWIEPAFQTIWWAEPLEVYPFMTDEYKDYVNSDFYQNITVGNGNRVLIRYLDIIENLIFITSFISIVASIKSNDVDIRRSICLIAFIGGFLFHVLWETKCIYVIPFYLCLLPYSSNGLDILFNKVNNFRRGKTDGNNKKIYER